MREGIKPAILALGVLVVVLAFGALRTEAHKGITSKYNYNIHIFPILKERCALCHYEGGPAPMSLGDWMKAVPWAESAREHLITEKMPPWYADPTGPAVRGGHFLPTQELDMLLSWLVGGTPRYDEKSFVFGPMAGVESPVYEGPPADWVAAASGAHLHGLALCAEQAGDLLAAARHADAALEHLRDALRLGDRRQETLANLIGVTDVLFRVLPAEAEAGALETALERNAAAAPEAAEVQAQCERLRAQLASSGACLALRSQAASA